MESVPAMTNSGASSSPMRSATAWLSMLSTKTCPFPEVYTSNHEIWPARAQLISMVLKAHIERFGDGPVRVFRSPGRINLRGMHVDTHGGFLNLMTHQRETVLAVRPVEQARVVVRNVESDFGEIEFNIQEKAVEGSLFGPWLGFLASDAVARGMQLGRGRWNRYLEGAVLAVQARFPTLCLRGLEVVAGSDLPRGAALSSSHALCVAMQEAITACNGVALSDAERILAARDAEWYAGARSGVSDQGAMILGRVGQLAHGALLADDLDVRDMRYLAFPEDLCVLAVYSHTERSLSGKELSNYTRNRFAYSMALDILRMEMGPQSENAAACDRFSMLTSKRIGGNRAFFRLLGRVPEKMSLEEMRNRYALPRLEEAYQHAFGNVPEEDRPNYIHLRGPLLYGLTESERARVFFGALEKGDYATAGACMSIGHDGDRVRTAHGTPFMLSWDDATLDEYVRQDYPVWKCPGGYGASSPALDYLVDTALRAGALGASLTGAGMAGTVLALCLEEHKEYVAEALRISMNCPEYHAVARIRQPLSKEQASNAVVVNQAPAGAGELVFMQG